MTPDAPWSLYIIRCKDGSLYTGITKDVARRFAEHTAQGKKCAKYLKGKTPLALVYREVVGAKSHAYKREYHIKSWPKEKKEQLLGS